MRRIWPACSRRRERRIERFGAQPHFAADEFQISVAHQRAGQQAGFDQNLEAVADAQHQAAVRRELPHRRHDGRKLRDRAAAQIVAIGESAGQDHRIDIAQGWRIVPDEFRRLAQILVHRKPRIVIAITAGKDNNAKFHELRKCRGGYIPS